MNYSINPLKGIEESTYVTSVANKKIRDTRKFLFLSEFRSFSTFNKNEICYGILLSIIRTLSFEKCDRNYEYFRAILNDLKEKSFFSSDDSYLFLYNLMLGDEDCEQDKVYQYIRDITNSINSNRKSFHELSAIFNIRILVKNYKKLERLKQFERILCPITLYIIETENDCEFFYPYKNNSGWGFVSSTVEQPEYTLRKLDKYNLWCYNDHQKHMGRVTCSEYHSICEYCIQQQKNVFEMKCPACQPSVDTNYIYQSLDPNYIYQYLTVINNDGMMYSAIFLNPQYEIPERKLEPLEAKQCKNCQKYSKVENELCYFCNLELDICKKKSSS